MLGNDADLYSIRKRGRSKGIDDEKIHYRHCASPSVSEFSFSLGHFQ
jgi:hypothetical protein